jgi:hypothetical protein
LKTSGFAIVDITNGRAKLAKHFDRPFDGFKPCPEELRVPISLTGYLDGINSRDDGESQEFTMTITRMDLR